MYFTKLPEILYLKYNKNPYDGNYILIKNIFSRIKIIDNIKPSATIFDDYFVKSWERPDTIAMDYYENPKYDWVIILLNNITNIYSDWVMPDGVFNQYVNKKYQNVDDIHHYETLEIKYKDKIIMPSGKIVEESFQFLMPTGTFLSKSQSRIGVSNYQYEVNLNEKRKEIILLKPEYLSEFEEIFQKEIQYTPSTEYIDRKLILA
jgi:hypothetical protein